MVLPILSSREQCDGCQPTAAQVDPPQLCWYSCQVSYTSNQTRMQMWLENTLVKNKFYARPTNCCIKAARRLCTLARRAIKQVSALQMRYRFLCETHAASQGAKKTVIL